jgi:hypothetical protein
MQIPHCLGGDDADDGRGGDDDDGWMDGWMVVAPG